MPPPGFQWEFNLTVRMMWLLSPSTSPTAAPSLQVGGLVPGLQLTLGTSPAPPFHLPQLLPTHVHPPPQPHMEACSVQESLNHSDATC